MMRLLAFLGATAVFVGVYILGSTTEVSVQDAEMFREEFSALVDGIDAMGIFVHNGFITAIMLIPGIGVIWGLFSAWSTGYAFAALSSTSGLSEIPAIFVLITPFGILELAAYSLALSRSALFVTMVARSKSISSQIRPLVIDGGIVAVLLAVAAIIESIALETSRVAPNVMTT